MAQAEGTHISEVARPPAAKDEASQTLEEAHLALLRAYVGVIHKTTFPSAKSHRTALVAPPSLTSVMVRAHIRRQLKVLTETYVRVIETLDPERDATRRAWLKGAAEGCESVAETLRTWKRPSVLAVVPLAVGVVAKLHGVSWSNAVAWVLAAYVLYFSAVMLPFVVRAFRRKRQLFSDWDPGDSPATHGIYALEDTVYALLERAKPPERQLDLIACSLAGFALIIIAFVLWVLSVDSLSVVTAAGVLGGIVLFEVIGLVVVVRIQKSRRPL